MRLAALAAGLLSAALAAAPARACGGYGSPPPRDVDLVLCLDVSNSMDGLIASAKLKLWAVVNELAKVRPTPNLRVGLYSYGHTSYPAANGWVRKELDLSTDLDEVYARLNALTTNGGEEYVARVTRAALAEQKWSAAPNALRLVFVCGNEPADQDKEVSLGSVASAARKAGVIVNTLYCGPASNDEAKGWAGFAAEAGGKGLSIDQEKARVEAAAVATPFDKELAELSGKLNGTYVAVNSTAGREAAEKQVAQDRAAADAAPAAAAERGVSKASGLYRNGSWDLVDKLKDDPKFDLAKLKDEELPEEMRKLKPDERAGYLKKKAEERAAIQRTIGEVSARRQKHLDAERAKRPKPAGERALDEALTAVIREQAAAKGFAVEAK
jgi:hypothetical protein